MPRVGRKNFQDKARNDKHGCKNCRKCGKHVVIGPAKTGSDFVTIEGDPVLTVGDIGKHEDGTCCGNNQWRAVRTKTDHGVTIAGKAIFCADDITLHDEKDEGRLIGGSDFVSCGS